eukprot:8694813-Pyramimonas_sp.AAC.1
MIYAEAYARDKQRATTTTLVDISKCFGRVCWRRVLQAAEHYGFPTQVLQLCLAMYSAPRRIKWTTSFSYSCQVSRGVLPGCSIAMFLLQLVMMLPFD